MAMVAAERQPLSPQLNDLAHTLKRVEHGRQTWIIYETARHDEFLLWWKKTEYGHQLTNAGQSKIKWSVEVRASPVWQHFYQAADVHLGRPQVICRSCLTSLNHPDLKSHGTSAMSKHRKANLCLERRGNPPASTATPGYNQGKFSSLEKSQSSLGGYFSRQVLDAILSLQLPLEVVEQPAFQNLLHAAQCEAPNLQIPSAKSLYRDLRNEAAARSQSLTEKLPADAKVSLSLGAWVQPCGTHFAVILASFFDTDWNYCETLLAFEPLSSRPNGSELCQLILDVLSKRKLLHRVFSVKISPHGIDEEVAMSLQEALLSSAITESSQHLIQTPAIDEVIEICLRHFLEHIESTPDGWSLVNARNLPGRGFQDSDRPEKVVYRIFNKMRSLAEFLNSSNQRRQQFMSIQPQTNRLMLFRDLENCAHSTFSMLTRAHKLKRYIDQFCHRHEHLSFRLSDLEWGKINQIVQVTRPFLRIHSALKRAEEPTVHRVFSIYVTLLENLKQMIESKSQQRSSWNLVLHEALVALKTDLLKLFQKSFDSSDSIFIIAALLTSQSKRSMLHSNLPSEVQEFFPKRIDEKFQSLLLDYKRQAPRVAPQNNTLSTPKPIPYLDRLLGLPNNIADGSRVEGNEVTRYLAAESIDKSLTSQWRDREHDFPVLTQLARDVLSFPATGTTLEKVFDIALNISHSHGERMDQGSFQDILFYMFSEELSTDGPRSYDPENKARDGIGYKCVDDDLVLASDVEQPDSSDDEILGGIVDDEILPVVPAGCTVSAALHDSPTKMHGRYTELNGDPPLPPIRQLIARSSMHPT
ncbi:hypothetical protein N7540_011064 [Penicillium herquei]|nr:hypothetical protein N7540_011064 [Penicillium herquei]